MKEDQQKSQFFKPGSDTLPVALGDSPQGGRSRTIEKAGLPFKRGDVIDGKFEVIDFLGEGGMGAVYRVKHLTLGKELALLQSNRPRSLAALSKRSPIDWATTA